MKIIKIEITKCWKCGKVLTDENGRRVEDSHFDSRLRKYRPKNLDDNITWALCKDCNKKGELFLGTKLKLKNKMEEDKDLLEREKKKKHPDPFFIGYLKNGISFCEKGMIDMEEIFRQVSK